MNDAQRLKIRNLREAGLGYKKIAEQMQLSENTVKTYCRRHGLGGNMASQIPTQSTEAHVCLCCGAAVKQNPGRKEKKFCSDKCRRQWWKEHDYCIDRKAYYTLTCYECGNKFKSYGNKNRKYCSHNCYIKNRFGKGDRENE